VYCGQKKRNSEIQPTFSVFKIVLHIRSDKTKVVIFLPTFLFTYFFALAIKYSPLCRFSDAEWENGEEEV
jgi:hypothetical protein